MGLRVLVSDPLSDAGLAVLKAEGIEVDVRVGEPPEVLKEILSGYDGLVVRSGTQVTAEVLNGAGRLRVIGRAGVGVDNIDIDAATRHGILVLNTPEGNTVATAEHTIAMMLALARQIPQAHAALVRDQQWRRGHYMGVQVQGKILGVLGLGRVGGEVARRALGLEMQVMGYDPFIAPERAKKLGVELAEVDDICRQADFITVHTPLTKATENLLGIKQFALMKPGVRIVNCARGGIVDEQALYKALVDGKVAGAALDVLQEEPPRGNPLLELENVVLTPHLGASTAEAQVSVAVDVAKEVVRALRGEPVSNAVNLPAFRGEHVDVLMPYMNLVERLGRLYTELLGGGHGKVEVIYSGDVAQYDCRPLTTAVLKGMLNPVLHEAVNLVNAPLVARERQIQVTETKEEHVEDFPTLVVLRTRTGNGERMVAGTLTRDRVPTLVLIDGYRVNIDAPGYILVAHNVDRPGMIGRVGTLLGERGVNIAYMQVGRKAVGGYAVMVLGIDNPIPDEVLQELDATADLWDVRLAEW